MLQLLPSGSQPSGEDVFIADSLNGIQLSHIKKALLDAGSYYLAIELADYLVALVNLRVALVNINAWTVMHEL